MKYQKVLFVCSGNTCRSPMAQAIFEDMVRKDSELKQLGICARSAGTICPDGRKATGEAIHVIQETGLDLSSHRSSHINKDLVDWADIILVMEDGHKQYIRDGFPDTDEKVHLLSEFVGEEGDIPDPIGCGIETYRVCAEQLIYLVTLALKKMKS